MTYESVNSSPSISFQHEASTFFAALEHTPPDAVTACTGWTAHEVVAHAALFAFS